MAVAINPNFTQTITLYNHVPARYTPEKKERWYRKVLDQCFFKAETRVVKLNEEASKESTYTVRIPPSDKYLPYPEWVATTEDGKKQYFTMAEDDIVVLGECLEEVTGEKGATATEVLLRHKPDAFQVTSIADNTARRLGKHYRLGG